MSYNLTESTMPMAGDLIDLIDPVISIDEFQPKTGHEFKYIVVGYYCLEESAAEDVRNFLERGLVDVIDIEVSPNPDENGKWLLFVEVMRTTEFWKTLHFLNKEIERLIGSRQDWVVTTYHADHPMTLADAVNVVQLKPSKYAIDKVKHESAQDFSMEESLREFFDAALLTTYELNESELTIYTRNRKLLLTVKALGQEEKLLERAGNDGLVIDRLPSDIRLLQAEMGNEYTVHNDANTVIIYNHVNEQMLILDRHG